MKLLESVSVSKLLWFISINSIIAILIHVFILLWSTILKVCIDHDT